MSAVLTLSGLGCYGLANVHAETDTNVERKLKIFAHYAEAEKPILDYAIIPLRPFALRSQRFHRWSSKKKGEKFGS